MVSHKPPETPKTPPVRMNPVGEPEKSSMRK
jgi:hypothetical protein